MTKQTGEQMLIELGFEKKQTPYGSIFYQGCYESYMSIEFSIHHDIELEGFHSIDMKTYKAIHQCLLDFGWITE